MLLGVDRNAFNSANYCWIKDTLAKLHASGYLARFIESYPPERFLWYQTDDGPKENIVIAGVPQGSVLANLALMVVVKHPKNMDLWTKQDGRQHKLGHL